MLCIGEGISFSYQSLDTASEFLSPRMSQQTESSGESSPEQIAPLAFNTDTDDTSSLLDGPTPVPAMIPDEDSFVPSLDFQISTMGGSVYSDYYDRIREDAEWNELGQMTYVPLYGVRTSHGSFSSDRMSSEGSVSPSLPSPIGEHLKTKRDSSSSVQFPIVPGVPQPFPDPMAERAAREGYGKRGGKPYATILEPKADYGALGGEYGSSSQDSHADVFGGSQESLNNGYGGGAGGYSTPAANAAYSTPSEYGMGGGYGRQQQSQRVAQHSSNGGGGGRRNRQHYNNGSGYGNNSYADYSNSSSYGYEQQSSYDSWRMDAFESTNKYGGPITHHNSRASSAVPPQAPAGPLPNAFSRANINDEQKNNLMANLARLCNQRSY